MKSLKLSVLIGLSVLCLALGGCGLFGGIDGSGNLTTVGSDLSSFTRVSIANAVTAHVTYGAVFSIAVTIDDNLVQYLHIEKNGDELSIHLADGHSYFSFTCVADVTLPVLAGVSAANASSVEISGFDTADDLSLSAVNSSTLALAGIGAGNVTLALQNASGASGTIDCGNLDLSASNAATASLSGGAGTLTLSAVNSCSIDLSGLAAAVAGVSIQNASWARVRFAGTLSGAVTAASSLRYIGNPASVSVSHDVSSSVFQM